MLYASLGPQGTSLPIHDKYLVLPALEDCGLFECLLPIFSAEREGFLFVIRTGWLWERSIEDLEFLSTVGMHE